jgi:leucyl/phenylalanyl-tRNA---protein transferase
VERLLVGKRCIALTQQWLESDVGHESEPGEILQNGRFVFRPAADAIVIFDAQQYAAIERPSDAPDVDRVDDMSEMEVARRRWREACNQRRGHAGRECCQIGTEERIDNQGYVIPFLSPHDPFPPVAHALKDPNGLLAAGADLSTERLLDAYAKGIFPWFGDDDPVLWWSPDPRMVMFTTEVHVSRSLRKTIRSGRLQVTFDSCFGQVMRGCAEPRRGQDGTWITDEMAYAYQRLFDIGCAHSVEVWQAGQLVGGVYGVSLGRMFFGESMFSRVSDASKVGLVALVRQIERWGFTCVDCQMSTAHLASLGAREIPRATFLRDIRSLVRQTPVPSPWRFDEDLLGTICT